MTKRLNIACSFLYEFVLLFTLVVVILTPFHSMATQHFNITKIIDKTTVSFIADRPTNVAIGDILPVYRFNPDWIIAIGKVKVIGIKNKEVICTFDPATFRWPMGRQGRVVTIEGAQVKIDMGSNLNFKVGDLLLIYDQRIQIGRVRLTNVSDTYSYGKVIEGGKRVFPGSTASEFIIPTQVAFFKNDVISFFEIFCILLMVISQCYLFIFRRSSMLAGIGNIFRSWSRLIPKKALHLALHLVLCVPFVWFIITYLIHFLPYMYIMTIGMVSLIFRTGIPYFDLDFLLKHFVELFYVSSAAVYFYVFFKLKKSPILAFWHWIGYHANDRERRNTYHHDIITWALHLLIAYAFGSTLFSFLRQNCNIMLGLVYPDTDYKYILSHFPHIGSFQAFFSIIRYLLWEITIMGCLLGYGHSILGYLWGKKIRNLDFTVVGWLVNATCYPPLLGFILLQMLPPYKDFDPLITQGPLLYFSVFNEFLLNLFYTLSIWNLGTMFGVMTDKGVRTSGFYSVVRHPSYTLESAMFLSIFLNELGSFYKVLAVLLLVFIYYLRSEREDQFMSASNPEYKTYQQKTVYKFIPGIY